MMNMRTYNRKNVLNAPGFEWPKFPVIIPFIEIFLSNRHCDINSHISEGTLQKSKIFLETLKNDESSSRKLN